MTQMLELLKTIVSLYLYLLFTVDGFMYEKVSDTQKNNSFSLFGNNPVNSVIICVKRVT